MKQKQIVSEALTCNIMSLNPGDAFVFINDVKENCPQLFMVTEGLHKDITHSEGNKLPNCVSLQDGEHYWFDLDTVVIPIDSEVRWNVRIAR